MFSKTQKILTGSALALGVGVLGIAAAGAANAADSGSKDDAGAHAVQLKEVPGVKLPTDAPKGTAIEVGPVDAQKLLKDAGHNVTGSSTLVPVPGVKLPTDVKIGHATVVGPIDPATIPAGPHTTAPAPKA
ncbi:hypothetical protein [Mycetocola sp. JXN-3]|uniref:hypothetical protein n=1 Tax=Mycetocola sp. JXN-3 TaxID=2116510 RepID=UPI00165D2A00|nr:hypothetical protein [Mycetocola sp. JXN-3]